MDTVPQQLARNNLRQLWWLRNIAIACEALILILADLTLPVRLPLELMFGIIVGQAVVNVAVGWRLRDAGSRNSNWIGIPLLFDVAALSGLLALSGGAGNPFTSLFILQVILAATLLSTRWTWVVTLSAVACYTLLLTLPLPPIMEHGMESYHQGHHGSIHPKATSAFDLHIYGMWGSFVILALLVAWFITRLQATINRQSQLLAASEQLAILGGIAASAAHELGTPLSSIALLAEAINDEEKQEEPRAQQLALLRGQIERCKEIISRIALKAGVMRAESGQSKPAEEWLRSLLRRWQEQHPLIPLNIRQPGTPITFAIVAEYALEQAITNLLDNAADASPDGFSVEVWYDRQFLYIRIEDEGSGFPPALLAKGALQQPHDSSKPGGMGMGLYLTRMVAERLAGELRLENRMAGGARVTLSLQLARIVP